MVNNDIYNDISTRTNGDIYIGVVGAVRTGKSTFISKVMDNFVLPNISNKLQKQIATDEMPQSSAGKTIMTTQPMFVPANAVKVKFNNKASANIRLVDCVGYFVEGASGNMDGDKPRYVKTPWNDSEMTFEEASEYGTNKVIKDYSTIGVVVTTDGSFGEISRENFVKAEEKVVDELKKINKPFVIVLNTANAHSEKTLNLSTELEEKYGVPVVAKDVLNLNSNDITNIFEKVLLEFPMNSFNFNIPDFLNVLDKDNSIISDIISVVKDKSQNIAKMKDYYMLDDSFNETDDFMPVELCELDLGKGVSTYSLKAKDGLFYKVLSNVCGEKIDSNCSLMSFVKDFAVCKRNYSKIKDALECANENGYGIVIPSFDDMTLEEPVLVKQGNNYGVKVKATAPSLHIMKVDIKSEISPMVGSDKQGEDMANYIIEKFENNPENVWNTQMFGKTLQDLVGEGMNSKIAQMPKEVQGKLRKTMTKIVNDNKGGIICILL